MSRREDIDNAIWSDPDFEDLSLAATTLYLWTWTNPRCGMAGIYKVSRRAMYESKVPADQLDATLAELAAARFAFYDSGVLFVRTRVKHMRQKTEQIAKSIRSDLAKIAADHPLRAMWVEENGAAPWLVRFLGEGWWSPDTDTQPTLSGESVEGQAVGSLEPNPQSSSEGRSTLPGNGNGSGTGTGLRGRGAGEGAKPKSAAWADTIAAEHFPGIDPGYVRHHAGQLQSRGVTPTVEMLRPLVEQHRPAGAA